ncbi:MAG: type IV secretion system DNA-binding domain-containing protein [Clostridia bacterium]|nr:type IV secretion system DNA-binding domain-containing protein [Clostridia bacterium]
MDRQNSHGSILSANHPPKRDANDKIVLLGTHNGVGTSFGLSDSHLDKHSLFIGSTGCGKTTLLNKMIDQIQSKMTQDDVMIIFDSKGDFYSKFGKKSGTVLLGNSNSYYKKSVRWNIFKEICADGWDNRNLVTNAQEICKNLFAEREKRTNNPFFPNAARDLLASLLIFILRTGQLDVAFRKEYFYNDKFKQILDCSDVNQLLEFLSFDADARSVASYINGGGEQANGVLAEMYSVVRDIFTGVFAEHGNFSIRDFVKNKGGQTLYIEYDLSIGQTLTPMYRLLFDLALKEALGRQENEKGSVYFILDEFRLLPHLQHIDDGVNFGRSLGVKVFAGLQNVEQLFETYKESRGRSILAGFSNLFLFHNDDPSTLKYLTERSGENVVLDEYFDVKGQLADAKPRNAHTIEAWDLVSLMPGEAIVSLAFGKPFKFKFKE